MLKFLVRLVFYKILYRVEVINQENIKDLKGMVLCPNHSTWMDGVFIWALKSVKVHAMAKAELFKNPITRWIFTSINMFPIERGGKDFKSVYHAVNIASEGKCVAVFPEGTRNAAAKGIKPKVGAVYIASKSSVPNIPVYITENPKLFSKVKIVIGKPMQFEFIESDKEHLRKCTAELMEEVYKLKEEVK
ncbi:MAG: lysophospholipid acyltransferase family protein [Clostridia bacterium]